MDIQNHYYGHSAALARYAELSNVRHINGLLQHGWTIHSPSLVHFADFAKLPQGARRLVWSHHARGWNPNDDPFETTPIGAPFLYLSALTQHEEVTPFGKTVAFPVHDTHLVKLESVDDAYARELAERDGPSIVCLHPEDLDNPVKARMWSRHGHEVVSAGGRRDPDFLGRILRLVRGANRVVSNQVSTAIMYAAAEGTPTAIYGPEVSIGTLGTSVSVTTKETWPEFHRECEQRVVQEIALDELGISHVHEPAALRGLLGWDRRRLGPVASYWVGAPLRKAGAVLGVVKRPQDAQDAGSHNSPFVFLKNPLSHLPGTLPRINSGNSLPEPLSATPADSDD